MIISILEKKKKLMNEKRQVYGGEEGPILNKVIRVRFIDKMTFEERPKESELMSCGDI